MVVSVTQSIKLGWTGYIQERSAPSQLMNLSQDDQAMMEESNAQYILSDLLVVIISLILLFSDVYFLLYEVLCISVLLYKHNLFSCEAPFTYHWCLKALYFQFWSIFLLHAVTLIEILHFVTLCITFKIITKTNCISGLMCVYPGC